jgi:hypothetical protein
VGDGDMGLGGGLRGEQAKEEGRQDVFCHA